jgi:hypothetical protein
VFLAFTRWIFELMVTAIENWPRLQASVMMKFTSIVMEFGGQFDRRSGVEKGETRKVMMKPREEFQSGFLAVLARNPPQILP